MPDYNNYHFETEEICFYGFLYMGVILLIAYTFYKSVFAIIALLPLLYVFC